MEVAISEKEYLILSDLAYDNLVKPNTNDKTLDEMYFQKGKLSAEGKTLLGVNRYAGSELRVRFQGMNIGNRHYCSLLNQLSLKSFPKTAPDNRGFSLFPKLLPVHKQYLHQT